MANIVFEKRRFSMTGLVAGPVAAICLFFSLLAHADTITMAISEHKPPYIIGKENRGIEVDIAREALKLGGHQLVPVYLPQKRAILEYTKGKTDSTMTVHAGFNLDGFLSDVTITYQNHAITLAETALDIQTLEDIRGHGIVAFPNAHIYLGPVFANIAETSPDYREIPNQDLQAKILLSGRADIAVSDKRIFSFFAKKTWNTGIPFKKLVFVPIFPPSDYRNIFRSERVRDDFNRGLKLLRASGDYDRILTSYENPVTD